MTDKIDLKRLQTDIQTLPIMTPGVLILACIEGKHPSNIKYLESNGCNVPLLRAQLRDQVQEDNESIFGQGMGLLQTYITPDMEAILHYLNSSVTDNKVVPTFEDVISFIMSANNKSSHAFEDIVFALKTAGYNPNPVATMNQYKVLSKHCVDLVVKAKNNKIDPLIGREAEVTRMIEILAHYKKKNPLLVGEAGVGKTAIVEGLASAIAQNKVPEALIGAKIFSTSIAALMAGTKFRGDVEEKMQELLAELKKYEEEQKVPTILFIDEIHQIIGAGTNSGGQDGASIANIIKPQLANGELSLIGATTDKEYKRTIQKDDALNRRMQVVRISPPSDDETIEIIRKGIAPVLTTYHGVKFSKPVIESAVRLSSKYITDKAQPDKAISVLDSVGARLRTTDKRDTARVSDVERLISTITGTPMSAFKQKVGKEEYVDIEARLNANVFGQTEAVKKIAEIYERSKAGLSEEGQPIGSVLAIGPTGVGKTEVAKSLAELTDSYFLKINMGEYTEEHSVSKLFGAPPGYVGHNEGGLLTNAIRKNPHSIILLDEIEKAHTKVYEALLGIIDGAKMTDGEGNTVDFTNTFIIMTSNVGAASAAARKTIDLGSNGLAEKAKAVVSMAALQTTFSPEFRNKLSAIIKFNSLGEAEVRNVTDKFLNKAKQTLKDKKGIEVEFTEAVYEWINKNGFDALMGARPIKKLIDTKIIDVLVKPILRSEIKSGDVLSFDILDNDVAYSVKEPVTLA